LHYFKEELTGPEYAARFETLVNSLPIEVYLDTMVVAVGKDGVITSINPKMGSFKIESKTVVLAMGCRERTAGAIWLGGSRPAGVYTAGAAQRLVNLEGYRLGKKVMIFGSGDIGMIMARRMTYEGAKVYGVTTRKNYCAGLKRNIVQCLDDYGIPLYYNSIITRVKGKNKLEGIYLAPVDESSKTQHENERFIECDTLLLSVGLIPENDLVANLGMKMDRATSGAVVNQYREISIPNFFSAGNVLHVHDLVDNVSVEAEEAGRNAAKRALGQDDNSPKPTYNVKGENGVTYALPQLIKQPAEGEKTIRLYFRVNTVYHGATVEALCGDTLLKSKKYPVLAPGEMDDIDVPTADMNGDIVLRLK
jgi:thioredoxin reductase